MGSEATNGLDEDDMNALVTLGARSDQIGLYLDVGGYRARISLELNDVRGRRVEVASIEEGEVLAEGFAHTTADVIKLLVDGSRAEGEAEGREHGERVGRSEVMSDLRWVMAGGKITKIPFPDGT